MFWLDWILIWVPSIVVLYIGWKSQKYVKGVADFLTAGRVGGRYVISVASGEAGMGLISAVAIMEMYYNCGFAVSFWSTLTAPISLIMGLLGFCTYRFRETRAMTMGQFFEMRYSRSLRVTAAVIQSISGIVNYAIFPAVGARFIIYFLGLPLRINVFGFSLPTFMIVMIACLGLALFIALLGGQVTIMTTDCVQGLISYPMYAIIVLYIMWRFSWQDEMLPALMARPPGESFLNPYDIQNLRDFNLFYVFSGIIGLFLGRMSWGGTSGYNGAALNPHEAKMGGLLGTWRGGFGTMIFILLAVVAICYLNSPKYAEEARVTRAELATKTINDVLPGEEHAELRDSLKEKYQQIPARQQFSESYATKEEHVAETADPYIALTNRELGETAGGKKIAQTFATIYNQMLVSISLRNILPMGLTGIFAALMFFLMLSTDTTYMHSWGTIVVQDFVLPLRKKPFTPHEQIRALRWSITGVCIFALLFSYYFAQIDFILMFFAITGAIWIGAGVIITLGLYWKRGTTAGAYTSLIVGAVIAVSGIIMQQIWVEHAYPFFDRMGWVPAMDQFLRAVSGPFHPYVVWEMTPKKFPINSVEISFLANATTVILYCIVSLLTCKEPFNMDRLLRRGIYSDKAEEPVEAPVKKPFSLGNFMREKILGFDPNYTRGDKILACSVFIWSFGYGFVACFLAVIIWNFISPWPVAWWGHYFYIKNLLIPLLVAIVTTIWFSIGGTVDLVKMFKTLAEQESDDQDDGRVVGHLSAADLARFTEIEKKRQEKQEGQDKK
ncbi:MAG: sodium:panthothenate symporter [Lentisphaerae bacterium]|jgi:SSS family solute:Na+ symporter|nr:sodium:panthothenate symporter [Lentisphaerota bacterium]